MNSRTLKKMIKMTTTTTKSRWSPRLILEELTRAEVQERSRRSLEHRLRVARIGRFRPMADFDWHWPSKIDRPTIERALTLDFIPEARNFILMGSNGLGKTMMAQNIAFASQCHRHHANDHRPGEILGAVQFAMIAGIPYTALRDAVLTHPTLVGGLIRHFSSVAEVHGVAK
jgi:hypothetical protein